MTRENRDHHYRRDGTIERELRPPEAFPWSGFEENLVLALDAHLGITVETGVAQWSDQSPQANHHLRGVIAEQPAYSTDRGYPSLLFDGIDDFLACSGATGFSGSSGGSATTFCVARFVNTANRALFDLSTSPTSTNNGLLHFTTATNLILRCTGSGGASYAYSDTTNPHVFEGIHRTAQREAFQDGTTQNTEVASRTLPANIDELFVGQLANAGRKFSGHMHSLLVFTDELSASDRSTIRQRLGARWGITVS